MEGMPGSWFWKGCKPNSVCTLASGENHLSQQPIPGIRFAFAKPERAAPGFPIWPCTRWGFPCRVACASRGALLPHLFTITAGSRRRLSVFCGTVRRNSRSSRVYLNRTDLSYAASRPVVSGLSSPGSRQQRFSAHQNQFYYKIAAAPWQVTRGPILILFFVLFVFLV